MIVRFFSEELYDYEGDCPIFKYLQALINVAARRLVVCLLKSLIALALEAGPRHLARAVLATDGRVGPARVHPLAPLRLLAVNPVGPAALAPVRCRAMFYHLS